MAEKISFKTIYLAPINPRLTDETCPIDGQVHTVKQFTNEAGKIVKGTPFPFDLAKQIVESYPRAVQAVPVEVGGKLRNPFQLKAELEAKKSEKEEKSSKSSD